MFKLLTSIGLLTLLAACASTEKTAAPITDKSVPSTSSSTSTKPVGPTQQSKMDPLNDPNGVLAKRSVYFDFDKFDIRQDQRSVVDAHGNYIAGDRAAHVRVEGNADERGSREYNLALGQKRAEAVRKGLMILGAQDAQIEATSNGKEKPKAMGHDEASWAENRRADIVYTAH